MCPIALVTFAPLVARPPGVGAGVVTAVLAAAVLHAVWNALAHAVTDKLVGFTLIGMAVTVGAAVLVAISPLPAGASWAYLVASAAAHTAYNLLLMRSYRLGDFGQVYPLARGTSPLLVAVVGTLIVGEPLSLTGLIGVVGISAGLGTLVLAGGRPSRASRPALAAAVLTGVSIAVYTTLDGLGVRRADTVSGYTGWLFLLQGPILPLAAVVTRRSGLWRQLRPHLLTGLLGGVLSLVAYGLVLWAQTRGTLAPIASMRETSVIVGAIIATVFFGERFGAWRITASVLVVIGVLFLTL